jgi:hypothetical protein
MEMCSEMGLWVKPRYLSFPDLVDFSLTKF